MFYQLVPVLGNAAVAGQNNVIHASQLTTPQLFNPDPAPRQEIPSLLHSNFQPPPPRRPVQTRLPIKLRVGKPRRGLTHKRRWQQTKNKVARKTTTDVSETESETSCNINLYEDQQVDETDDDSICIPIRTDDTAETDTMSATDSENDRNKPGTMGKRFSQAPPFKRKHIKWVLFCQDPKLQSFLMEARKKFYQK